MRNRKEYTGKGKINTVAGARIVSQYIELPPSDLPTIEEVRARALERQEMLSKFASVWHTAKQALIARRNMQAPVTRLRIAAHLEAPQRMLAIAAELQAATGRILLDYKSSISYTSMEDWLATQPVIPRRKAERLLATEASKPMPRIKWNGEFLILVNHKDKDVRQSMAQEVMRLHTLPKGFRRESGSWKVRALWCDDIMDSLAEAKEAVKRGARVIVVGNATKKLWSLLLAAVNCNSALTLVDYSTKDIIYMGHTNMAKDDCFEDKAAVINRVLFENANWRKLQWKLNQPVAEWDFQTETSTPLEDDIFQVPEAAPASTLPHWARSDRYNSRWSRYESRYTAKSRLITEVDPAVNDYLDHEAAIAEDPILDRAELERIQQYFAKAKARVKHPRRWLNNHPEAVELFEKLGRLESVFGIIDEVTEEQFLDLPEWIQG